MSKNQFKKINKMKIHEIYYYIIKKKNKMKKLTRIYFNKSSIYDRKNKQQKQNYVNNAGFEYYLSKNAMIQKNKQQKQKELLNKLIINEKKILKKSQNIIYVA